MEIQDIGEIRFTSGDLDNEVTIKDFLKELICRLWVEEESFSGKRPFGNSGWQGDITAALIKNGVIKGKLDEDGYAEEFSYKDVNEAITEYIVEYM